jgi:hypothetical protein
LHITKFFFTTIKIKMNSIVIIVIFIAFIVLIGGVFGGLYATGYIGGTDTSKNTSTEEEKSTNKPPPPLVGTKALQLGQYNMSPWGGAAKFVDPNAQWIWNLQTAATDASTVPITFSNQYYNNTATPIDTILHIIVDDVATVTLNGTKIGDVRGGWDTLEYPKLPITLQPGNNRIDILATNTGGPAGLLVALVKKSDNTILLRSDASWVSVA